MKRIDKCTLISWPGMTDLVSVVRTANFEALVYPCKATKFEKFYSENPEYENSNIVLSCFSNNGIQTYNNVKDLLPHPIGFIFDSGPADCSFPHDFDIPGKFHYRLEVEMFH